MDWVVGRHWFAGNWLVPLGARLGRRLRHRIFASLKPFHTINVGR